MKYFAFLAVLFLAQCSQTSVATQEQSNKPSPQVSSPKEEVTENADELGDDFFNEEIGDEVKDPLEPLNRVVFKFNDKAYQWVLRPISNGYQAITPDTVEKGIGNFFSNLGQPQAMVNELLQGRPAAAAETLGNFLVNSTVGLGGLLEIKERHQDVEDLGQTLQKWGVPDGFYLVLPVIGPSTLRDTIGRVGDSFLYPTFYFPDDETARLIVIGLDQVESSDEYLKLYDGITSGAIDPYLMARQAYTEYRKNVASSP